MSAESNDDVCQRFIRRSQHTSADSNSTNTSLRQERIYISPPSVPIPLANNTPQSSTCCRVLLWKMIILAILIGALIGVATTHLNLLLQTLQYGKSKVEAVGWAGPPVFTLVYSIVTTLFFPAEVMMLSAGFLFGRGQLVKAPTLGFAIALLICLTGQLSSATLCYFAGNTFLQPYTSQLLKHSQVWRAVVLAAQDDGPLFIFLCRLSPLVPFTLSNYFFGCTSVKLSALYIGHVGSVPFTSAMVWFGCHARDVKELLTEHRRSVTWENVVISILGLLFALVAIAFGIVATRNKLKIIRQTDMRWEEGNDVHVDSRKTKNLTELVRYDDGAWREPLY